MFVLDDWTRNSGHAGAAAVVPAAARTPGNYYRWTLFVFGLACISLEEMDLNLRLASA